MRTKLLFTAVFFLGFLKSAMAQEYHPLLNNVSWIASDWVSCCRMPIVKTFEPGTQVTIGEYTYTKFVDPFPKWGGNPSVLMDTIYLREDIEARKVYKIVDGEDFLLYDFSLEQGDEITIKGVAFTALIDEVPVDGGTRKRITLQSIPLTHGQHVYQYWIEGVGTNAHPFYPDFYMYAPVLSGGGGYRVHTRCSFQNGLHVYGNTEYCNTARAVLGVEENDLLNSDIIFSPNPLVTTLTIDSGLLLENASVKLYNTQGQLVREMTNLSGKKLTLNRENLSSGLYFVQLLENGKPIKTAKILVD